MSGVPLRWLLPWPEGFLGPLPAADLLDRILVRNLTVENIAGGWRVTANIVAADPAGIVLRFPGWNDFGLVLRELSRIEMVLGAKSMVRIELGECAIRLPQQAFQRARHTNGIPNADASGNWIPETGAAEVAIAWPSSGDQRQHALTLTIDQEGGYALVTADPANPPVPAASLAPTIVTAVGVVISAQSLTFSFSRENPGLAADAAAIFLPDRVFGSFVPPDFAFRDVHVGPRGFTGSVEMTWPLIFDAARGYRYDVSGQPAATLFGINGGVSSFALTLYENAVQASDIRGALNVPYFEEPVDVRLQIGEGGDFTLALVAASEDGIRLTREELIALEMRSLAISKQGDITALVVSGRLQPLLMAADGLEWPRLDIEDLSIEQDITDLTKLPILKFREAWVDLSELVNLDLFGFHFELNRIGLGYQETDDKLWIDLTGSLLLIEQIPVGLGVEGFRLTWPRTLFEQLSIDGPPTLDQAIAIAGELEVKFDGVYLFFGVPDAVEFEGLIRFIKDAQVVGFAGDMALRVPATGLVAEAGLMVGMNLAEPPYPFLYVYFGIELPAGIPLAQSGLALKGALGLFGLNVSPDKTPEQNWYYDWYKRGPIVGAHPTNKWRNERDALAVGIGLTITTVDGYVKGVRGLLVLAIPGPILIIEGRALIFNGLTPAEPPMRALAVIDGREKIIQFNIEAEAELVEDMIDAYGMLEAFFDFKDLTNWHLYLGQDEPRDRLIRANVLKFKDAFLFKADAYLMVDMIGAETLRSRMGVFVGFKPPIPDIGPLKVTLDAVLEGRGEVTLLPEQFSGEIDLSANIELEAFGFGVQLSASAGVLTEGPKPLKVDAEVTVSAELPGLDPIEETFEFSWEAPELPEITAPLVAVTADSPFAPGGGALKIKERAEVQSASAWRPAAENSPVVPIDTRPILAFGHEVNDEAGAPGDNNPRPAFARHPDGVAKTYDVGLMRFTPTLTRVRLYEHRKGKQWPATLNGWTLVASSRTEDVSGSVARLPGVWMTQADPQDPANPPARCLHLWTNNPLLHAVATLGSGYSLPFDIVSHARLPAGSSHAEQLLGLHPDLMKCADTEAKRVCVNFAGAVGTTLEPGVVWEHKGLLFKSLDDPATVQQHQQRRLRLAGSWEEIRNAVATVWSWLSPLSRSSACLVGRGRLSIRFPEPVVQVWVRFCAVPKLTGKDPSAVIDTARAARNSKELKEIVDEAKAKGKTADPAACRYPVAHEVDVADDTWIIRAAGGFDCLAMFKTQDFAIAEICYLTAEESQRASRAETQCATNQGTGSEPQDILRPGSYYRLDIETNVAGRLAGGGANKLIDLYDAILQALNLGNEVAYRHVAFFQTEAPPTSLAPYIKWTNPQPQATRVFRKDDLAMRFLRPNVKTMYAHAPHNLEMLVRNAQCRLVEGYGTAWTKAGSASLLHEEQLWREHRPTVDLPNGAAEADDVLKAQRVNAELAPSARYELMVSGSEGGALLFEDGFTALSDKTWQPDIAGWKAEAGVLARQDNSPSQITAGDAAWTDVDVVAEIRLTNTRAGGVIVRASSSQRPGAAPVWNACQISLLQNRSGTFSLRLHALQHDPDDSGSAVAELLHFSSVSLQPGLWYRLRVSVVANRLRVWVFDDLVMEGTLYRVARDWTSQRRLPGTLIWFDNQPSDTDHQAIARGDLLPSTQGNVGLHAAGPGPEFRRMRVRDAVLQRISFITSAFAGFRELVRSGDVFAPVAITTAAPASQLKQTAIEASSQLVNANWAWHRAEIDFRFEELKRGREALEEIRLVLRNARAAHDAAFRALAEMVVPDILYQPLAPHLELYLLRNDAGRVFGLYVRSPESLDLRRQLEGAAGSPSGGHVGRTTITVTGTSALSVDIFHDADSTQMLIFRSNSAVWPRGSCSLKFTYHRNHGDETAEGNHRYDRPVETGGAGDVETAEITFDA